MRCGFRLNQTSFGRSKKFACCCCVVWPHLGYLDWIVVLPRNIPTQLYGLTDCGRKYKSFFGYKVVKRQHNDFPQRNATSQSVRHLGNTNGLVANQRTGSTATIVPQSGQMVGSTTTQRTCGRKESVDDEFRRRTCRVCVKYLDAWISLAGRTDLQCMGKVGVAHNDVFHLLLTFGKFYVFQLHLDGHPCGCSSCSCGHIEQGVHSVHDDANGYNAFRHSLSNKFGSISGHLDLQ